MKFLIDNWYLVLAALVSGALLLRSALQGGGAGQVNTNEAVRLVNREKGVLIDVCEPAEFAAGHASGARNIPFGSIETSKDLPTNKTLPLVLVCQTGARAGRAAGMLRKAGHANVQVLAGGMKAWREANLPIEKA